MRDMSGSVADHCRLYIDSRPFQVSDSEVIVLFLETGMKIHKHHHYPVVLIGLVQRSASKF